ncbi:hypothetical protein [Flavihumibacter fluvii]|uniref:hypothetical protein n=1 Tax=Flavihumibacter fluvii TaxID=2838157 RepID=UPI001BDE8564|nr:hypothetical protein [Flavihumibacter fluvii]ULQ53165.1 hypothetical protein KJS93_02385 [Flavihumibacter fluvii]
MDSAAKVVRVSCLVNTMGCNDCHYPRRMGPKRPELIPELRFSGGRKDAQIPSIDTMAIKNGWNLLGPDFRVAVGGWGASFSGRDLLPPMPWIVYKNLNDDDLSSFYHFLKTTTPANNVVSAPIPFADLPKLKGENCFLK